MSNSDMCSVASLTDGLQGGTSRRGVRHVKARGLVAGVRQDKGGGASTLVHTFEPIVATFSFRRDRHGR